MWKAVLVFQRGVLKQLCGERHVCNRPRQFSPTVVEASVTEVNGGCRGSGCGVVSALLSAVRLRRFRNENQNGDYKANKKDLI